MTRTCSSCGKAYPDAVFFCGEDGTITVQDQPAEDFDPRLGKRLGAYIVAARVADGAMGRVFEGRHPDTRARVAIKVLHAEVAKDEIAVERFKREFEVASEIPHPHVVKVLEFGATTDGSYFLTMEFLEGEELARALASGAPLAPARVVRVVSQVALALEHAHSFGFIHRDLKPDNVFLCRTADGDDVRVLDFGSVKLQIETGKKLTAMGTTLGSPYYMSPEQAMGRVDVDQQTDVFALGAVVYEMVTGKVAFEAPNIAKILVRVMKDQPPVPTRYNPRLPGAIDEVIAQALAKKKEARFATVREFAQALGRAFGLEGDVSSWARTPEDELRHQIGVAAERRSATAPPPADHLHAELAMARGAGLTEETPTVPGTVATPSRSAAAATEAEGDEDGAPAASRDVSAGGLLDGAGRAQAADGETALAATAPSRPAPAAVAPKEIRATDAAPTSAEPRAPAPGAAALRARLAGASSAPPPRPPSAAAPGGGGEALQSARSPEPEDTWTPPTPQGGLFRGVHPVVWIAIGMVLGGGLVALLMR